MKFDWIYVIFLFFFLFGIFLGTVNPEQKTIQKLCSKKQYDFCEVERIIYKEKGK